jgi:hypothetical protein
MTAGEFYAWWQAFQDIELGVRGTARNPGIGSVAQLIGADGGSIQTLMALDLEVEGNAHTMIGMNPTNPFYDQYRVSVVDAVARAKAYVGNYLQAEPVRQQYEASLDRLIMLL